MRSLAIGLAAATFALVMGSAAAAQNNGGYAPSSQTNPNQPIDPRAQSAYDQAQDAQRKASSSKSSKDKGKAAAAAPDAKNKEKGQAEAPPLLQQLGYACTVADATFVGTSKTKDDKGKEVKNAVYEVACSEGMGYVVQQPEGGAPIAFDCVKLATVAAKTPGQYSCALPANTDPSKGLQSVVTKSGASCSVSKARWVGSIAADKKEEYEVGCADGNAFIVVVPQPGSTAQLVSESCLRATKAGITCEFFGKDQVIAQLKTFAAAANRTTCEVSDGTYIGEAANHTQFYEVACTDGKSGFIVQTDPAGKVTQTVDCAKAANIVGGCKLTTISVGDTSDNPTYTKLAKEIGFDCNVSSYRSFGTDQSGRETVELACANQPAGAVASLPTSKGQTGEWINCGRAEARSLKCTLSKPEATYALINEQLKAKGKDCPVSGMRGMGSTATGEDYVEVTCSTGGGLVLKYAPGKDNLVDVLACAQAKGIAEGCKLQK